MGKRSKQNITHERLLKALDYNPETGVFTRKLSGRGYRISDKIVGYVRKDLYVQICVDYKLYLGHRLAWFYMTGEWPPETVDHINGDKSDNAWANLRLASLTQNNFNVGKPKTNSSGYKGVSFGKDGRYRANISINNKTVYLGNFSTAEEAYACYCRKAVELHGEFANLG